MWKNPLRPVSWDITSVDTHWFDVFTWVEKSELYTFALSIESKIVRVSPELLRDLAEFNQRRFSQKHPDKKFVPNLSSYKKAQKYSWKDNEYVMELDRIKYLAELWLYWEPWEEIKDTVLVISTKSNRILWIWYKVLKWGKERVRCFVRYSTLTEKRQKAELVIQEISQRFWNVFDSRK